MSLRLAFAVLIAFLVYPASRRSAIDTVPWHGVALAALATFSAGFLALTLLGCSLVDAWMPDLIAHKGVSSSHTMTHMWLITKGVWCCGSGGDGDGGMPQ
jgi:TRAP-type uncharacterized transport system fused permease subunit